MLRRRMLDAVENACSALGGAPAPAAAVVKLAPSLALHARGITILLRQIAALGPDEGGRTLLELQQRSSTALWAVVHDAPPPAPPGLADVARKAAGLSRPGEPLEAVLMRALAALEAAQTANAQPNGQAPNLPLPPPFAPVPAPAAAFCPPDADLVAIETALQQQAPAEPEPDDPMALAMAALAQLNAEANR